MTERYGPGFGDEALPRPSGRGAVTERLARRDQDAREIDLTDEATQGQAGDDTVVGPAQPEHDQVDRDQVDHDQADRTSSSAFEPAEPAALTADPPAEDERPGSSSIFDVDERAKEEDLNRTGYEPPMADTDASPPADAGAADITPTPVPAADPPAGTAAPEGLAEPETASPAPAAGDAPAGPGTTASLVGSLDTDAIRNRFLDIQAGFIDEPRQAVEEAGRFVDDLLQQVADALRTQRDQLAGVTDEGSTEDLRLALRAYRQFVDRILGLAT